MTESANLVAGRKLIEKAVKFDTQKDYSEALRFYQDGIEFLMLDLQRSKDDSYKAVRRKQIESYLTRAETLKRVLAEAARSRDGYREQLRIPEGAMGFGYSRIFSRCLLDGDANSVVVEDPYVRSMAQMHNLCAFAEVLIASESPINALHLITAQDEQRDRRKKQEHSLDLLQKNLSAHNLKFDWEFRDTLHDREIRFSNGWIVKIGRGLDYFQRLPEAPAPGYSNLDLRRCKETTVDIFHRRDVQKSA